MSLVEKRLFLLDMDGTIYLSETLFDGTKDFLRYVRESGGRYLFGGLYHRTRFADVHR